MSQTNVIDMFIQCDLHSILIHVINQQVNAQRCLQLSVQILSFKPGSDLPSSLASSSPCI